MILLAYWVFASLFVWGMAAREADHLNRSFNWFDYLVILIGGLSLPMLLGVSIQGLLIKGEGK